MSPAARPSFIARLIGLDARYTSSAAGVLLGADRASMSALYNTAGEASYGAAYDSAARSSHVTVAMTAFRASDNIDHMSFYRRAP